MKFLSKLKKERGQSLVEFALVLPILLVILCGILDFGWLFYNQLNLNNACREVARYSVVHSSEATLDDNVKNMLKGSMGDSASYTLDWSNPADKTNGDVVVKVDYNMQILTPFLGVINGSMTKPLEATVTMKVES